MIFKESYKINKKINFVILFNKRCVDNKIKNLWSLLKNINPDEYYYTLKITVNGK